MTKPEMGAFSQLLWDALTSSGDPNEQVTALNDLRDRVHSVEAQAVADETRREDLVDRLPERISANTVRSAFKMHNAELARQIEEHRAGGSE
ncbi:MAG TPA: hypothetical protein VFE62_03025 [Gemmataceae bacterium]|nr:hypothetical protein [Gemmataceae bacterium]